MKLFFIILSLKILASDREVLPDHDSKVLSAINTNYEKASQDDELYLLFKNDFPDCPDDTIKSILKEYWKIELHYQVKGLPMPSTMKQLISQQKK